MLIGLAATEYCHKSRRYGNGLPWSLRLRWPLAQVMAHYGWQGMFTLLTSAAALTGLLLMPLLIANVSKREHLAGSVSLSDDRTYNKE